MRGQPHTEQTVSHDVVTTHTAFSNLGSVSVECSCGWRVGGLRQNSATQRAKRHVDMYPDHEVTTTRVQTKRTFSRRKARS
jgi:hypothetical protein